MNMYYNHSDNIIFYENEIVQYKQGGEKVENKQFISANSYFPSQPEIQMTTDDYKEVKFAKHDKNSDIALYYQFKTNKDSVHLLSLIPDGCFDILFCCNPVAPSAILWTSPIQRRKQPNFQVNCEYFGVRFYPEQRLLKLKYPMKELLDKQVPLFHVLPIDSTLTEQIGEAKSFNKRMEIFEKFIHIVRGNFDLDQKIVNYSIERIYTTGGNLSIRNLSEEIGYSEQYVRRKFEEYIGFSPKKFCQIVQFQNSIEIILNNTTQDIKIMDVMQEGGYYDQAHFIRGFKKLADFTPNQYVKYLN